MKTLFLFCGLFAAFGQVLKAQIVNREIIKSSVGLTIFPTIISPNHVRIYPNPATSSIWVRSVKPIAGFNFEIFDQAGLSCLKLASWKGEAIDVSQLQTGIYIVRFTRGKENYSQKLIVQREQ